MIVSGTSMGTTITQLTNPAYKCQNIPGSRTELKLIEVEQRTWCTKQKNTSVRQRQKIESPIGQNSPEKKRKTKK